MKLYGIWCGTSGPAWMEGEGKETTEFYTFPDRRNDWGLTRINKREAFKTKAEALQKAQAYAEQQVRRYSAEVIDAQEFLAKVLQLKTEEEGTPA